MTIELTHQNPSSSISRGDKQVLGRQQLVYDVDNSIGADDVTGYDFSFIIYMHRVLKSTRKGKNEHKQK